MPSARLNAVVNSTNGSITTRLSASAQEAPDFYRARTFAPWEDHDPRRTLNEPYQMVERTAGRVQSTEKFYATSYKYRRRFKELNLSIKFPAAIDTFQAKSIFQSTVLCFAADSAQLSK